jgi:hypothetical protein
MTLHTPDDLRTQPLDLLQLTPEARVRLAGLACAKCGATENLQRGGYAYTRNRDGGLLGWAVRVCEGCGPQSC